MTIKERLRQIEAAEGSPEKQMSILYQNDMETLRHFRSLEVENEKMRVEIITLKAQLEISKELFEQLTTRLEVAYHHTPAF